MLNGFWKPFLFPVFPRDRYGDVRNQRVTEILTRGVYAGCVYSNNWDVNIRKGQHEALISYETFSKIQARIKEKVRTPYRADLGKDFILRGYVLCGDCNKPLTACWSKSSTGKKHPYYLCHNKTCVSCRKSIRRDVLEGAFETLLSGLKPRTALFNLAQRMFKDLWEYQLTQAAQLITHMKTETIKVERQIENLLDRIVETQSPDVAHAYENRIRKLGEKKLELTEKSQKTTQPQRTFEEMFERAMTFLSNPYKLWGSGCFEEKRTVLKMVFLGELVYHRDTRLRTPKTALPFRFLDDCNNKSRMAHWGCA